jgi:hypothetical protein
MNILYFLLSLAIVIPIITLIGHLFVAYRLAPERAKEGILIALTTDSDFQRTLIVSVVNNFLKSQKDGSGNEFIPIDVFISRAKEQFKQYFNAQSQEMSKDMDQVIQSTAYGENPLIGVVLSQIPKKYRGLLIMAMQMMGNNNNQQSY